MFCFSLFISCSSFLTPFNLYFMLMVLFRTGKRDELPNPSSDVNRGMYDGFSETQTESQVYAPLIGNLLVGCFMKI